jgi:ATP-dependent metalloprotease
MFSHFKIEKSKPSDFPKFNDVIGLDQVLKDLREVVDCLKNREKYKEMGAELPNGVLLEGPPGTGKTLIARALANECGANFYYKSGSELEDMFVGESSKKIKKLFTTAKKNAPAIIFIDEIDSVAGSRNEKTYGHEGNVMILCLCAFRVIFLLS